MLALATDEARAWTGVPLVLLDVPLPSRAHALFVEALEARSPAVLTTAFRTAQPADASEAPHSTNCAIICLRRKSHPRQITTNRSICSRRPASRSKRWRSRAGSHGSACRSIKSRFCCVSPSVISRWSKKHSRRRKSQPISVAVRLGPIRRAGRFWRCWPARPRVALRRGSPSIYRSGKCPSWMRSGAPRRREVVWTAAQDEMFGDDRRGSGREPKRRRHVDSRAFGMGEVAGGRGGDRRVRAVGSPPAWSGRRVSNSAGGARRRGAGRTRAPGARAGASGQAGAIRASADRRPARACP